MFVKAIVRQSFFRKQFLPAACVLFFLFAGNPAWAIIDSTLQMQLGNPSGATTNATNHTHYLIQRTVETIDYNDTLGEPNWASWDLTTADTGSSGRSSSFYQDTTLPAGFTQVDPNSYSGSGYDRGHMCPSGDRTDNTTDNKLVFYMSNMIPQAPDNNQGVWASLENDCRSFAAAGNEILITCGPSSFDGSRIPSGSAAIPAYTWKIAVVVPLGSGTALSRINTSTRVIAVKIPNIAGVRTTPWQNFVTNVYQLETDTGFTFFTALPANVATVLKGLVDGTPAPGLTSFSPANGSAGTSVVITGTNFTAASTVWFNGTNATFTVNSSTQITATVPSGATTGNISVITPGGLATSAGTFTISASGPVVINTQPVSKTNNAGLSATFTVAASGSGTLSYQWIHATTNVVNGANISGATTSALTLTNISQTNAGSYSVIITNTLNSVTSVVVTLTVIDSPAIVTQPQSQTNAPGGTAVFSVSAVGSAPLSFQWKKGTTNLVNGGNITGATTTNLTVSGLAVADSGSYSVVVSNTASSTTSTTALLVVAGTNQTITFGSLANKNYGDVAFPLVATASSGLAVQFSVVSGGATITGTNLTITSSGSITVRASQPGNVNYNPAPTVDQSFTAAKVALTATANSTSRGYGATNPVFSGVISGLVVGDSITATYSSSATAGSVPGAYSIVPALVDAANRQTNYNVSLVNGTLTVTNVPPSIIASPDDVELFAGQDAIFEVSAGGSPPLSYFWRYNGANISGATQSSYTRTGAQVADAGSYSVVVTNVAGSATSDYALLTVDVGSVSNIVLAQWTLDNTNSTPVTSPAPTSGAGVASLVGGTTSAFVSGSGSTDSNTNANGAWNTTTYPASTVSNKQAGAQFKVSTLGYKNILISWDQRLSTTASKYYRLQYSTNGTTFVDFNVISMTNTSAFQSFSNNLTGLAGVDNNSNFVYRVVSEWEKTAANTANANYVTVAGGTYGTSGTVRYDMMTVLGTVQPTVFAPSIDGQPQGQGLLVGSNATFNVSVLGTLPLVYQWQWNGTNLSNATGSALALNNLLANQSGNYRVVVTNSAGSTTSSNAMLTVYSTVAASFSGTSVAAGQAQFNIGGVPGYSYIIQATDDLFTNWVSIQTNPAPFVFIDTNTVGHAQRFFRVISNP